MSVVARSLRAGWRPGGLYRLPAAGGAVRYRVVRTAAPGAPLVVALHGHGSDARQIATLLPLDVPATVLAPRAPLPLADGGWSWFPVDVRADGSPLVRPQAVVTALRRVAAFARSAVRAWRADPARVALIGYSQGGTMALSASLVAPAPFAAIGALSGSVVGTHLDGALRRTPAGVPLFVGHGRLDRASSVEAVRGAVERLRVAGRDIVYRESDAPHVVTREQRGALTAWLHRHILPP